MSLTEAGHGLLGTYLTWDDLQRDFFELFGLEAKLGEEKTVKDIADGKGFVSRIGVIENLWMDQEKAKEKAWPRKLAIKMVTLLQQQKYGHGHTNEEALSTKEALWKRVHNRESSTYSKLGDEPDLAMLKVIKIQPFTEENPSKGYLIMEFVENVVSFGMEATLSDELIDQLLLALAQFHSKTVKFSQEEKEEQKMGIYSDMFGMILHENFVAPQMKRLVEITSQETADQMKKGVEKFRQADYSKELDDLAEHLGMERILCHGDLWTVNLLFTQPPGQAIRLKALIDYQISHFGCVGHDLARLFTSTMSKEGRKQKAEYFIKKYYHYLEESWPQEVSLPFTLDQALDSYKRYLPFASFIVAITISAVGEMTAQRTADPADTWSRMKKKIVELAEEVAESLPE